MKHTFDKAGFDRLEFDLRELLRSAMSIDIIRTYHRQQRFMMKMQSRIDRSMEAYIRTYVFGFSPMTEREKVQKKAEALIKQCRSAEPPEEYTDIAGMC